MRTKHYLPLLLLAALAHPASSQTVINSYARVTGVSGNTLTIKYAKTSTASLTGLSGNTFAAGSQVVIMQMQDNAVASFADNSTFGNAVSGAPAQAGLYESLSLSSNIVTNGSDSTVTLSGTLRNSYNFGPNSRVQLITLPKLGTASYTLTTPLTAIAWNGNRGGIVALQVNGTLTLGTEISVSGKGFRGGRVSTNAVQGVSSGNYNCVGNYFFPAADSARNTDGANGYPTNGYRGEGVYARNANFPTGRGKLLNGGGGGNANNSGGGGGGNYTTGGEGGPGYYNPTTPCPSGSASSGVGGVGLDGVSIGRFYMGGGGGGGQQNDNVASRGGNGAGLVLLVANTLATAAGTPGTISAMGETAPNSFNDGSGGGGAGGSVLLQVSSFSLASDLNLNVGGGNGGNVQSFETHGGGGGGGIGAILTTTPLPTSNVVVANNAGAGGLNGTSAGTRAPAGSVPTMAGANIITSPGATPLPVVLTVFAAQRTSTSKALLTWQTAQEVNSQVFVVERRTDSDAAWTAAGRVAAAGKSTTARNYVFEDTNAPTGRVYYRLQQVDLDGAVAYSPVRVISGVASNGALVTALPNPFDSQLDITIANYQPEARYQAQFLDSQGREVRKITLTGSQTTISTADLPAGMYFVRWSSSLTGPSLETIKLVKR